MDDPGANEQRRKPRTNAHTRTHVSTHYLCKVLESRSPDSSVVFTFVARQYYSQSVVVISLRRAADRSVGQHRTPAGRGRRSYRRERVR